MKEKPDGNNAAASIGPAPDSRKAVTPPAERPHGDRPIPAGSVPASPGEAQPIPAASLTDRLNPGGLTPHRPGPQSPGAGNLNPNGPGAESTAVDKPNPEGPGAGHVTEAYAPNAGTPPVGRVDVISCGIGFPHDAATLDLLQGADVIYGSRALLERCPLAGAERRVIGAQARRDALDALAAARAGQRVAALASGDALYHGFGGTLHALAGPEDNIIYHPGITAFQALFHRIGQPWDEARLFSAHAGEEVPVRGIAESRLAVAYAGSRHSAADIARAVLAFHPGAARRRAVIAERLGSPDERIITGPLEDAARLHCGPTSILALFPDTCGEKAPFDTEEGPAPLFGEEALPGGPGAPDAPGLDTAPEASESLDTPGAPPLSGASGAMNETPVLDAPIRREATAQTEPHAKRAPASFSARISGGSQNAGADVPCPASFLSPKAAPILPLGLPEEDYERENNLITASDVRAVILSRLRLPAWGTLWDIGAGSGSVGLEAAGLRPGLRVYAVERQPARCDLIERNRQRLGVPNYTLYKGDALEAVRASGPASTLPDGNNQAAFSRHAAPDASGKATSEKAAAPGQNASAFSGHAASPSLKEATSALCPDPRAFSSFPESTVEAFPGHHPLSDTGTPAERPPHQSKVLGRDGGPGEGTTLLQKGFPSPGSSLPPRLPDPDRVFIGGGGKGLPDLLDACMERLKPGGLMVAASVTLESFCALCGWQPGRRVGLCRLDIAEERPLAGTHHHLKHRNTITVFIFQKEIPL